MKTDVKTAESAHMNSTCFDNKFLLISPDELLYKVRSGSCRIPITDTNVSYKPNFSAKFGGSARSGIWGLRVRYKSFHQYAVDNITGSHRQAWIAANPWLDNGDRPVDEGWGGGAARPLPAEEVCYILSTSMNIPDSRREKNCSSFRLVAMSSLSRGSDVLTPACTSPEQTKFWCRKSAIIFNSSRSRHFAHWTREGKSFRFMNKNMVYSRVNPAWTAHSISLVHEANIAPIKPWSESDNSRTQHIYIYIISSTCGALSVTAKFRLYLKHLPFFLLTRFSFMKKICCSVMFFA